MNAWMLGGICVLLLLVAACGRNQLDQNEPYRNLTPPPPPTDVRPDIPQTGPPAAIVSQDTNPQAAVLRQFLNTTLYVRTVPTGIIVGDANHPFLIGKRIGDVLPLLTRYQLGMLASPMPSLHGQPLRAEPYIRFDFGNDSTGQLIFVRDPDTGQVEPELFFEEGKPMFEYAYLLKDGAFPLLIGEELALFGHTYEVHTATNTSIQLYGKDVAQFIYLVNNSALEVNGTGIANTYVDVDPWHFTIRYFTPVVDEGGIRLKEGENLRSKLQRPEELLTPAFNIIYDGLEQNQNDTVMFDAVQSGMRLDLFNALGTPIGLTLASAGNGTLRWGGEHPLHVAECSQADDWCVAVNDAFLVTSPVGVTRVFAFTGVGDIGDVAELVDLSTNEERLVELADTKQNVSGSEVLDGTLNLDGATCRVSVLHNVTNDKDASRVSVDADCDGAINGDAVTIVTHAHHELRFPLANQTNTSLLVLFASPQLPNLDEEVLPVQITQGSGGLVVGLGAANVTLGKATNTDTYQGISTRGVLATLFHSPNGIDGEQLTLAYPPDFRAGLVRVTG